jgi:putative membrane protein
MNKTNLLRAGACALLATVLSFPVSAQQGKGQPKNAAEEKSEASQGALGKQDAKFLRDMAAADLAEVETGKLAAGKASAAEVKKFAEHMVDEHGKGLSEGQGLAKAKSLDVPNAPAKRHQAAMKRLESESGARFDKAYMNLMLRDHQETLKLVQNASRNAKDEDIKAAAGKKVPVVQKHLQMAREIAAALKSDATDPAKGESGKSAPGK